MNAQRRKEIQELSEKLQPLKDEAERIRDEEQEYYDNMPEAFQNGDKGTAVEETIGYLDEVCSGIESAIDNLAEIE